MFDKLKQIKKLREIQKSLGKERADVEKSGIRVTINGNIEIEDIRLNPELDIDKQAKILKDCINDAVKKMQYVVAQKMSQFGNFEL